MLFLVRRARSQSFRSLALSRLIVVVNLKIREHYEKIASAKSIEYKFLRINLNNLKTNTTNTNTHGLNACSHAVRLFVDSCLLVASKATLCLSLLVCTRLRFIFPSFYYGSLHSISVYSCTKAVVL